MKLLPIMPVAACVAPEDPLSRRERGARVRAQELANNPIVYATVPRHMSDANRERILDELQNITDQPVAVIEDDTRLHATAPGVFRREYPAEWLK
jgi:hypothetical protein